MKSLKEISSLKDKKVLLRVDFNVPVDQGKITESFRVEKLKDLIQDISKKGAKIILVSHISDIDSFSDLIPQIHLILGQEVGFLKDIGDIRNYFENYSTPGLLENIRKWPGEKENSEEFASLLARDFDLYINNAFAVSHRKHASVSAITKFLPSYAGPLLEEEVYNLEKVLNAEPFGKVVIIGGAKAETKVPVIKNFIDKSEKIVVGGVVLNDILKARGMDVKESVIDGNYESLLSGLDLNSPQLFLPEDFVWSENKILDIGIQSSESISKIIGNAKLVVWNGPVGLFEDDRFSQGTRKIAQAIVDSSALKIVGGGDTIAAIAQYNLVKRFDFVSTGGGAMLSFLAGNRLPGLEALDFYE